MAADSLHHHIECLFAAYDRQDAEAAAAQFAPGGKFHEEPRNKTFTKAEFREYLESNVFVVFPDYEVEEYRSLLDYRWATVIEWRFSGTHEGHVGELEPTGNRVTLPIVSVVTGSEEGITSFHDFFDPQKLDQQLGRE